MKKYLLGSAAILLAVVFSAFTTKQQNDQTFVFTGDLTEIQDQSKWFLSTEPHPTETVNCFSENSVACSFTLSGTNIDYRESGEDYLSSDIDIEVSGTMVTDVLEDDVTLVPDIDEGDYID